MDDTAGTLYSRQLSPPLSPEASCIGAGQPNHCIDNRSPGSIEHRMLPCLKEEIHHGPVACTSEPLQTISEPVQSITCPNLPACANVSDSPTSLPLSPESCRCDSRSVGEEDAIVESSQLGSAYTPYTELGEHSKVAPPMEATGILGGPATRHCRAESDLCSPIEGYSVATDESAPLQDTYDGCSVATGIESISTSGTHSQPSLVLWSDCTTRLDNRASRSPCVVMSSLDESQIAPDGTMPFSIAGCLEKHDVTGHPADAECGETTESQHLSQAGEIYDCKSEEGHADREVDMSCTVVNPCAADGQKECVDAEDTGEKEGHGASIPTAMDVTDGRSPELLPALSEQSHDLTSSHGSLPVPPEESANMAHNTYTDSGTLMYAGAHYDSHSLQDVSRIPNSTVEAQPMPFCTEASSVHGGVDWSVNPGSSSPIRAGQNAFGKLQGTHPDVSLQGYDSDCTDRSDSCSTCSTVILTETRNQQPCAEQLLLGMGREEDNPSGMTVAWPNPLIPTHLGDQPMSSASDEICAVKQSDGGISISHTTSIDHSCLPLLAELMYHHGSTASALPFPLREVDTSDGGRDNTILPTEIGQPSEDTLLSVNSPVTASLALESSVHLAPVVPTATSQDSTLSSLDRQELLTNFASGQVCDHPSEIDESCNLPSKENVASDHLTGALGLPTLEEEQSVSKTKAKTSMQVEGGDCHVPTLNAVCVESHNQHELSCPRSAVCTPSDSRRSSISSMNANDVGGSICSVDPTHVPSPREVGEGDEGCQNMLVEDVASVHNTLYLVNPSPPVTESSAELSIGSAHLHHQQQSMAPISSTSAALALGVHFPDWCHVSRPTSHPRRRTGLSRKVKCRPLHRHR